MKAASCKIASLHPQADENRKPDVGMLPSHSWIIAGAIIREKIFCSYEVSNRDFRGRNSSLLPPFYITLENCEFNS